MDCEFGINAPYTRHSFVSEFEKILIEKAVCQNGKRVPLSDQEFLVLQFFAEHPGGGRTKKPEADSYHPESIQTVRCAGCKFVVQGNNLQGFSLLQ